MSVTVLTSRVKAQLGGSGPAGTLDGGLLSSDVLTFSCLEVERLWSGNVRLLTPRGITTDGLGVLPVPTNHLTASKTHDVQPGVLWGCAWVNSVGIDPISFII